MSARAVKRSHSIADKSPSDRASAVASEGGFWLAELLPWAGGSESGVWGSITGSCRIAYANRAASRIGILTPIMFPQLFKKQEYL